MLHTKRETPGQGQQRQARSIHRLILDATRVHWMECRDVLAAVSTNRVVS